MNACAPDRKVVHLGEESVNLVTLRPNRSTRTNWSTLLHNTAYKTTKAFPETLWKRFSLCVRASAGRLLARVAVSNCESRAAHSPIGWSFLRTTWSPAVRTPVRINQKRSCDSSRVSASSPPASVVVLEVHQPCNATAAKRNIAARSTDSDCGSLRGLAPLGGTLRICVGQPEISCADPQRDDSICNTRIRHKICYNGRRYPVDPVSSPGPYSIRRLLFPYHPRDTVGPVRHTAGRSWLF